MAVAVVEHPDANQVVAAVNEGTVVSVGEGRTTGGSGSILLN
jgi:hypothetical protein